MRRQQGVGFGSRWGYREMRRDGRRRMERDSRGGAGGVYGSHSLGLGGAGRRGVVDGGELGVKETLSYMRGS